MIQHTAQAAFNDIVINLSTEAFQLNYTLADHPEISSHEFESVKRIGQLLETHGLPVTYEFANLPTAFKADAVRVANPQGKLAILCEYDALPEIGHACGHSASAAISVLAAIALHELAKTTDLNMDVDIIGTPDEEATGCKVDMCKQGIFKNYDFAIMVHLDGVETHPNSSFLALDNYRVRYYGQTAHAAGEPWNGVNACNGVQLAIHALDMMRQQVLPETRIGTWIITAGTASNIIPDFAEFECCIRHTDRDYLNKISKQAKEIFKGAALCTGTRVEYNFYGNSYDSMNDLPSGDKLIEEVMTAANIPFTPGIAPIGGSSDIGNVSFQCPAFHPKLRLAGPDKIAHTVEFAAAMKEPPIETTILEGTHIIGDTLLALMADPTCLKAIRQEFQNSIK